MVVQLLVDDGVPSKGHRANIMNEAFSQTGVSVQTPPGFRYCCVIDYANGYASPAGASLGPGDRENIETRIP